MKKELLLVTLLAYMLNNFTQAQETDIRLFAFGHSLIDHRPPLISTPSDETTIMHWMYLLAEEAGYSFAAGGKYGFLPQHAALEPFSQWGYDIVPGVWESDTETFAEADISTIMITAANFIQDRAPSMDYYTDPGVSPISATEIVMDWVHEREVGASFYIYENWPDMAGYLQSGFPASTSEFNTYNNYLLGDFHEWWIEYQDALLGSRPDLYPRMIPTGPIIAKLLTEHIDATIPITELYEDDAPHGRASIYFLAGLISYMAIYQEKAPQSYVVPDIVHTEIRSNYSSIVDYIWQELEDFNDEDGNSRVFFESVATSDLGMKLKETLFPNPVSDDFSISDYKGKIEIYDVNGGLIKSIHAYNEADAVDVSDLASGVYVVKLDKGAFRVVKL